MTDPISTSLIRLIFSSITLFSSCGALDMTVMYISIMTATGIAVGARHVHLAARP